MSKRSTARKALRWTLFIVGGVLIIIAGALIFVTYKGAPTYAQEPYEIKVEYTPEQVAEGKRIVTMVCTHCHLDHETGKLSGKELDDIDPALGNFHSANITQDPEHGIGAWTDGEIAYMLRTGITKSGRLAMPMPTFATLAEDDMKAIIAFLRSDAPLVQPVNKPDRQSEFSFLGNILANVAFKPVPIAMDKVVKEVPAGENKVNLGEYLVLHKYKCADCHSADFATNDPLVPENSKGFMGGGNKFIFKDGTTVSSANITMHKENGIGKWTEEQFVKAVISGQSPHGPLRQPMPPLTMLTENEAKAMFAYLQTVPVSDNKIPR